MSVLYRTLFVRDLYFIFAYIGLNPYYIRAYIGLYRRVHRTLSLLFIAAYIGLNPYHIAAYIARTSGSSVGRTHPPPLWAALQRHAQPKTAAKGGPLS